MDSDSLRDEKIRKAVMAIPGGDLYVFLGMPLPPPDADLSDFKRAINAAVEVAKSSKDKDKVYSLNDLRDNLTKNPSQVPAYNKMRREKTLRVENYRSVVEHNKEMDRINPERDYRERERELREIEERERELREAEEELQNLLVTMIGIAADDDFERRSRQNKMITAYVISIVLSSVAAFLFTYIDAFYIFVVAPWIVIIILTVFFKESHWIPWIAIILFVAGAVIWSIMMVASVIFLEPITDIMSTTMFVVACVLPIIPVYKANITIKTKSDKIVLGENTDFLEKKFGKV
jgi:hypothetical protein